jgi:hypothetical protein
MSLEMCFWMVTDEQLSSFRQRRGAFFTFSQSAPSESGVVDHRNVVLFHFLLNGTKKGASGPLRIFETWFRPYRCADLLIDDSVFGMDPFGIAAADTRALLERLPNSEIRARQRLYLEMRVRRERRWRWFRMARLPTIREVDEEGNYLEECFANLREICERGCKQLRADMGARLTLVCGPFASSWQLSLAHREGVCLSARGGLFGSDQMNFEPPNGSRICDRRRPSRDPGSPRKRRCDALFCRHVHAGLAWWVVRWLNCYGLEAVVRRRPSRSPGLPRFLARRLDPSWRHGDVLGLPVVSPLRTGVTDPDAEGRDIRLRDSTASFAANLLGLNIRKGSMEIHVSKKDAR